MLLAGTVLAQSTAPSKVPSGVPAGPVQGPPPKNLTMLPDGHVSANSDPANPDKFEVHVVAQGESLSGIAAGVMKDMKLWPQLWEGNEHIVNPHWIYPNDKVLIRPVTKITEAAPPGPEPVAVAAAAPSESIEPVIPPAPPAPGSRGLNVVKLRIPVADKPKAVDVIDLPAPRRVPGIKASDVLCSGFIRNETVQYFTKVSATYERGNATLSAVGDYVRINLGSTGGINPGAVYNVVRPTRRVSDLSRTKGSQILGMHYLDVAQIKVVQAQADTSLARVTVNCEAIEVGDLLVPFVPLKMPELSSKRPFTSTMAASESSTKGTLVLMKNSVAGSGSSYVAGAGFPTGGGIVGEGGIVYVDLGKDDEIKIGDLFVVYRGQSAIGEIVILKIDDKTSSALVTYSTDALVLGDRVEHR
jgi:hypothetical protein